MLVKCIKSVLWLLGASALGYTLLQLTKVDEQIIAKKYSEIGSPDSLKKRRDIVETLRLAAENKNPMYRQTKEEIENNLKANKDKKQ